MIINKILILEIMKGLLEIKDFTGSVKDVDFKNRIVTGYFNNWDSIDSDGDVIRKGAGAKSIAERKDKIFFLNQHDWKQPHGFAKVLEEKEQGTYFLHNREHLLIRRERNQHHANLPEPAQ